jgi:hypothetical protein
MKELEEAFNEKIGHIKQENHSFEQSTHHRFREVDNQMSQRPTEEMMYKWIREQAEQTSTEIREPLMKDLDDLRSRLERLDGEQFRFKLSANQDISDLKASDEHFKKLLELETASTDKKVEHQRINFNKLIEDRIKREE